MKKSALLIIDVQNGMFLETNPVFNGDELLTKLQLLIAQARHKHIPIFYIQHNAPKGKTLEFSSKGWEIHPDIKPLEQDVIIQKKTLDSFFHTNLDEELNKREVNHVYITGIQSEACVDTTCRRAFSMEYQVTLVIDAHSTFHTMELSAEQIIHHHNQVLRWFSELKRADEIDFSEDTE